MPSTLTDRTGRRRQLAVAIIDDGRQQQDIAAAAGINPATLSGMVTGRIRAPKRKTQERVARALGRDVDELFPAEERSPADTTTGLWDPAMAARVRAECEAAGVRYELTDEQMDFIGAVIFSRPKPAA